MNLSVMHLAQLAQKFMDQHVLVHVHLNIIMMGQSVKVILEEKDVVD